MAEIINIKDKIKEKTKQEKPYGLEDIEEEELDFFIEDFVEDIEELLRVENILNEVSNDIELELEFYPEDWLEEDYEFLDNPEDYT